MPRCRSGDGCTADATTRLHGDGPPLWCDEHAEPLRNVAALIGGLSGPQSDRLRGAWAVQIGAAVWTGEKRGAFHELFDVAQTNPHAKAALKVALGNEWIVKAEGTHGYERGPTPPPGVDPATAPPQQRKVQVTKAERVEQLGKLLAERGPVTRAEAGEALGIAADSGSWSRILKVAAEKGLAVARPGVIEPGSALPHAPKRDGIKVGRAGFVPTNVVERIRRERAAGRTFREVADALESDGVPSPAGKGAWHGGSVSAVAQAA